MSLSVYQKKRNFAATPEPAAKEKTSKGALRFVVQKHDASQLHYDFRLEMEGVLKSWAVPKGPSLNPADKRLARRVEDHPYDYRTFEGVIPEGNYGAGTVIVWDEGTYEPAGAEGQSRGEQEKLLLQQLQSGSLKLHLKGHKLKGEFTLLQLKREKEGLSWLLIKNRDAFASEEEVAEQVQSVLSGKTIAQVAHENGQEPHHPEAENKTIKAPTQKAKKPAAVTWPRAIKSSNKKVQWVEDLLGDKVDLAKRAAMPVNIKPMLATLVDAPFDGEDWLFEIKWDGYRAVAYVQEDKVELVSRNKKPLTHKYAPVTEALQALGIHAVLDGEIVAVNENGLADFQLLQNWQNNPQATLRFYVFDILWLEGYDITALPLVERKRILQHLLPAEHDVIKNSDHIVGKGNRFFNVALDQGLEGIMAKKWDSVYELGRRTESWLKIKVVKRQEVIICGFTQPRKSRKFFGALLLGVYKGKELVYVGHTGSGFNTKSLEQIYNRLQPLVVKDCPFAQCPKGNMPVTWVRPKLVCEIKFTEWTKELIARHPIFMGLREDKKASDVSVENSKAMASIINQSGAGKSSKAAGKKAPQKAAAKKAAAKKSVSAKSVKGGRKKTSSKVHTSGLQVDLAKGTEQVITLDQQELKLTSLDKLYWKKEGCTKGDVINYYLQVAPYMLPYLLDRPQSMNRYPNGVGAPHFFQKDVRGKVPVWIQTHEDFSESTHVTVQYLVCSNEATLVYMANLGCIEINPWHSRVKSVDRPDWCLIDLDPDKNNSFDQVVETARVVKEVLDAIGAEGYPKTSGSTGLHIYIPLGAKYTYEQSRQLAELIVQLVHQQLPQLTSVERNPAKRKGKIYLDFLQNSETQTAAAPYSLRPRPGMPVSAPLHWDEVKKGLTSTTYNINNIGERVRREGDLFAPVLGKGIDLQKVLKKVQAMIA